MKYLNISEYEIELEKLVKAAIELNSKYAGNITTPVQELKEELTFVREERLTEKKRMLQALTNEMSLAPCPNGDCKDKTRCWKECGDLDKRKDYFSESLDKEKKNIW